MNAAALNVHHKDYGTGINPKGVEVRLRECETCGSMFTADQAHSKDTKDVAAWTEPHKAAMKP